MASQHQTAVFLDSGSLASTAILELFPPQGEWREGGYFALPGNRIIELVDGLIEVLPVPSIQHQLLARSIFLALNKFVDAQNLGIAMTAPTRVQVADGRYREPDVLFVPTAKFHLRHEQYWNEVDLVGEYWIVDPRDATIRVLQLESREYHVTNEATCTTLAASQLLKGFMIDTLDYFKRAA